MKIRRSTVYAMLLGLWSAAAFGQPRNLDQGYPVQMEDPEPIPYGTLQAQGYFSPSAYRNGNTGYSMETGVLVGFAERLQASLTVPVVWGTVLQTTGGDLLASTLYNFADEGEAAPALALEGFVDIPMFRTVQNADFRLKFIASRTVVPETVTRLNLNVTYGYLTNPGVNERYTRWLASFGVSRLLRRDLLFAIDYSFEQDKVVTITSSLIEAGIRKDLGGGVIISGSVGVGLWNQSLAYRALVALQVKICDLVCPTGVSP